eukprot:14284330-Ditylum_brightwellii.AAC.1
MLGSDQDVIAQSAANLQEYGLNLHIHHVNSHQDYDTPYDDLDLLVRLNVDAGELTTYYHFQNSHPRPMIPRLAINEAQLLHGNCVRTGHYFKTVYNIAIDQSLLNHIKTMNK